MLEQLNQLRADALAELAGVDSKEELEDWYTQSIGRKGEVTLLLRRVGELPREERPAFGRRANEIKGELEAAYQDRADVVKATELEKSLREGGIDVTLPGRPLHTGRLHPISRTMREIYDIFAEMDNGRVIYLEVVHTVPFSELTKL